MSTPNHSAIHDAVVAFAAAHGNSSSQNSEETMPEDEAITLQEVLQSAGIGGNLPRWSRKGDTILPGSPVPVDSLIPGNTYTVGVSMSGWYLTEDRPFILPEKLYGVEQKFINRTLKTWKHVKDPHMGVFLFGDQGTGKTVTAKMIAIATNLPVIVINQGYDGLGTVLHYIQQDVVVYIDEFEKLYGSKEGSALAGLLKMLDGETNGYRRMFIMTSNTNDVNTYLKQRPGRLRYVKEFNLIRQEFILELLNDRLNNKALIPQVMECFARFELLTMDTMTKFIDEVNIHGDESAPTDLLEDFNIVEKKTFMSLSRRKIDINNYNPEDETKFKNTEYLGRVLADDLYLKHFEVSSSRRSSVGNNVGARGNIGSIGTVIGVINKHVALVRNREEVPTGKLITLREKLSREGYDDEDIITYAKNNTEADLDSEVSETEKKDFFYEVTIRPEAYITYAAQGKKVPIPGQGYMGNYDD